MQQHPKKALVAKLVARVRPLKISQKLFYILHRLSRRDEMPADRVVPRPDVHGVQVEGSVAGKARSSGHVVDDAVILKSPAAREMILD